MSSTHSMAVCDHPDKALNMLTIVQIQTTILPRLRSHLTVVVVTRLEVLVPMMIHAQWPQLLGNSTSVRSCGIRTLKNIFVLRTPALSAFRTGRMVSTISIVSLAIVWLPQLTSVVWTGSSTTSGGNDQIQCEDRLTPDRGHNVVRDGSHDHQANSRSTTSGRSIADLS